MEGVELLPKVNLTSFFNFVIMNLMEQESITIEGLARMIQKGFNETAKKQEVDRQFAMVDERFTKIDQRFNGVDEQFAGVNRRLDKIENLLIVDHRKRIEQLEIDIKELKGLLAVT